MTQAVLLLPLEVGGDGGALDADVQAADGLRRIPCHLIRRPLPVGQAQVVVLRVQLHKGQDQLLFDLPPKHMGHFVAVQLRNGVGHFDFFHGVHLRFSAAFWAA